MARCGIAVAILIAGWLAPASARAAGPYDPALTWGTIHSERFAVHYPDGGRNFALRVSRLAEEVLDDVTELFGFVPEGRIELILSDASDRANGSAQVMPRNTVRMFLTAPTELTGLSSYDDWLRILLVHELAHICDIDQSWGLTRALRWVFGKYIQMNGFTPQFLSEGAGVYAETVLTPTGRGRSSYVAMLLRMAALEDRFLEIDQAHVQYSDWPGPNAAYFYGGFFHLWLANQYGRDHVRDLHQFNAAMPLPYIYWPGAQWVFGASLPALWEEWRQHELQFALEVQAGVEARGVTASRRVTFHGRNITGARYHPSGEFIIYSRSSPEDGSTVRRVDVDGSDDRHLVLQTFSPRFSFSASGDSFFYSQNAINERFNNYADLYRYDLKTDEAVKLKPREDPERSLRARDPDLSPDGKRIVFVQNRLHQSWLSVGVISGEQRDELEVSTLVPPHGDMQQASPRFSPDGRLIAVSTWFDGGKRDIVLVDATSGELVRRVTSDTALDGNPAWSPDGRYLLYESDLDGISNIYAYDLQDEAYSRITRVVGGAFQADVSPDGKSMLFRNASGIGFDIHEMPFDPPSWEPMQYVPDGGYTQSAGAPVADGDASSAWQTETWGRAMPRDDEPPLELRQGEREAPYSAWRPLIPFNNNWVLMPALFLLNDDPSIRLITIGQDPLATHTYVASAGSSSYTHHFNWLAAYFNDVWYPTFGLFASDIAESYSIKRVRAGSSEIERIRVAQRHLVGTLSVGLPIRQRHTVGAAYTWDRRTALPGLAKDESALGDFARLEVGYQYSFTRRFPYSVGAEHGKSLAIRARWYAAALGADFNEILLNLDGRWYFNNPLLPNHVLALRTTGAFAIGPDFKERFLLGGAQGSSIFSVQTESIYALRGFSSESGTGLVAAYLEYRFPIWHVERGLWTLPVYLERFHGSIFADAGNTFGSGEEKTFGDFWTRAWRRIRGGRLGAGFELRADISLGWAFPLTIRSGWAWPVIEHGHPTPHLERKLVYYISFGNPI
ncbi:MAG: BamA/TamA family outer membrane protein [Myxococcota bacterium]